jgi:hypothetical protein
MNELSSEEFWVTRIKNAGDDTKKREKVFARILSVLTNELPTREMFIGPGPRSGTQALIEKLDGDELTEFLYGLTAGIEKGDWARLASHRTFLAALYLEVWRDLSLHSDT